MFKHLKLYREEGARSYRNWFERKNTNIIPFIKLYERADLTQNTGYQYNIMKLLGYDEETTSLSQRPL